MRSDALLVVHQSFERSISRRAWLSRDTDRYSRKQFARFSGSLRSCRPMPSDCYLTRPHGCARSRARWSRVECGVRRHGVLARDAAGRGPAVGYAHLVLPLRGEISGSRASGSDHHAGTAMHWARTSFVLKFNPDAHAFLLPLTTNPRMRARSRHFLAVCGVVNDVPWF